MTKMYKVNVTLLAKFEVEAVSLEEAERIVRPICEGGKVVVTEAADNQETLTGTCDVEGELDIEETD